MTDITVEELADACEDYLLPGGTIGAALRNAFQAQVSRDRKRHNLVLHLGRGVSIGYVPARPDYDWDVVTGSAPKPPSDTDPLASEGEDLGWGA